MAVTPDGLIGTRMPREEWDGMDDASKIQFLLTLLTRAEEIRITTERVSCNFQTAVTAAGAQLESLFATAEPTLPVEETARWKLALGLPLAVAGTVGRSFSFSVALSLLMSGRCVKRCEWAEGTWLQRVSEAGYFIEHDTWIGIKISKEEFEPWVPTQRDILSHDWLMI